ncbi:5'-methylthioadenosine/S-adenosylhomocysteine nucleosidase [Ideonella sp. BN130291]|uniref:5'-methylthioadenosine/S-adenosylhomocysteine nucleosidase n=1 Tax=Ideonella sp. BN130291 TaxID=3112940 RepID=UPI002E272537|nr:5'-methylthioadenosine/S-adenosylhomocysteine nucleosidase [Ideonella sp. BN130291]
MSSRLVSWCAAGLLAVGLAGCASAPAPAADATPRIAVISAFDPELALLRAQVRQPAVQRINGVEFITGELEGRPVVLFLSGISMTNAAMNTQLALDRFKVSHIVFSGIAGGVNPGLHIGDVTVPERWGSYLEAVFAREVKPGQFQPPGWMKDATLPNFGMVHPRPVGVRSARSDTLETRFWFEADPQMLAAARQLGGVQLQQCGKPQQCLSHAPQLVFGGTGVSGQAFVDNAKFREYTFATFRANVLDMETSAVAQVAYANRVPYIAFRSLSDLAGGGEGENEIGTFFQIAADNSAKVVMAFLRQWKP